MVCRVRIFGLTVAVLVPAVALAQAPPATKAPVAPMTEQLDPKACAPSDTPSTMGRGSEADQQRETTGNLSDKLARSGGVICPPDACRPGNPAADPAGRSNACHSAAGKPGRRPIRPAEVTARSGFGALLDSIYRRFLYRAHSGALFSEWRGSSAG